MSREWNTQEGLNVLDKNVPTHECDPENCEHESGFFLYIVGEKDGGDVSVISGTHRASPHMVIEGMISTIDALFMDSRPEGMPPSIAWSHGREALRKAIEESSPPPDIAFSLAEFIKQMQENSGDE